MSSVNDCSSRDLVVSSFGGVARGAVVQTLIYPLKVTKYCQQVSGGNSIQIALEKLRAEGMRAFYKGFSLELLGTSIKQFWCWPMITAVPRFLEGYNVRESHQQIITGLSIATLDAAISTPIERTKIERVFTDQVTVSLTKAYKEGWRGFSTHWSRLSVNWVAFLTAQKYLRERSRTQQDQPLSLFQLVQIGTLVALFVSIVGAPFDMLNTLNQAKNQNPSCILSRGKISPLYRGWPLSALCLVIHNVFSLILIDKLDKKTPF